MPLRNLFSIDHAIVGPFMGFPTFHHNEARDLTATLLTEVCHNDATEPPLQLITAETFPYATANTTDDTHLDERARDFGSGDRMLSLMYGYFIQIIIIFIIIIIKGFTAKGYNYIQWRI